MKTIVNLMVVAMCAAVMVTTAGHVEAQEGQGGSWHNDLPTLILPGSAGNAYVCKVIPSFYPKSFGAVGSISLELWSGPHCTGNGVGIGWICGEGATDIAAFSCDADNLFSARALESYAKMLQRAEANGARVRYYLSTMDGGGASDFTIRYMQFHGIAD